MHNMTVAITGAQVQNESCSFQGASGDANGPDHGSSQQEAWLRSASNMTSDEEYLMMLAVARIASSLMTFNDSGEGELTVTVSQFAKRHNISQKRAQFRLILACENIFCRSVLASACGGMHSRVPWAMACKTSDERVELIFSAPLCEQLALSKFRLGQQI